MEFLRYCFAELTDEEVDKEGLQNVFLEVDLQVLEARVGGEMCIGWVNQCLGVNLAVG